MKTKDKLYLILVVILVLAIAFVAGKCSTRRIIDQGMNNLIAARDSVHRSYVAIDGLRNSVWEKNAIILGQKEAIKAGLVREDLLKKIHMKDLITASNLQGTIKILRDSLILPPDFVFISIKDTSGVARNYAKIPFTLLDIKEQYLTLSAGMDKNKKAWFDLETPVSGIMSIGYKKSGFLKTTPVGTFTTENKNLTINQMDILIVQDSKKWYDKWWVKPVAGIIVWEGIRKIVTGQF